MDALANGAYSTVATAPSPATTGTSLVVAAGHGARFPTNAEAPTGFNLVVWAAESVPVFSVSPNAEIVRCTSRATDTLTITRKVEGTTARTVVVGDQVGQMVDKLLLRQAKGKVEKALGSVTTAKNLSLSEGDIFTLELGASVKLTFTSLPTDVAVEAAVVWKVTGAGPFIPTFEPAGIKWPNGEPAWNETTGAENIAYFLILKTGAIYGEA